MNSPNMEKYYIHWENGRAEAFKAARLYVGKALNHVRMLVVHLAAAVRVHHWRVGADPGCVTGLAQNCHSSRVLLQTTLYRHANTSH